MLTVASLNAAIHPPPRLPHPGTGHRRAVKARPLCCLRSEGHDNAKKTQPSDGDMEVKQDNIWRLFREAQQNILYLNKERLMAVEELNKANREKELLVARIKHLEAEKQAGVGKDKLSIGWELLLRLDSMVLTGIISAGEASDLRRLIRDHMVGVADVSTDIIQKKNAELLAELRNISDRRKKYKCLLDAASTFFLNS